MSWLDNPLPTYEEIAKLLRKSFTTSTNSDDGGFVTIQFNDLEDAQQMHTFLSHIRHRGIPNAEE